MARMDALARIKQTRPPFAELLGIEVVSASPDKIVAEMTVREELCTVPAVLHGGAVMAFADTLGAMGTIVNLPQGAGTTTIESKTNFVAPALVGTRIVGETTPVHRGRRTMIWQTRVSTPEGRLGALVTPALRDEQDLVEPQLFDALQPATRLVGRTNQRDAGNLREAR